MQGYTNKYNSKCHGCSDAHSEIQSLPINLNGYWQISGHLNVPRYFSGCSVAENNLYIFGGYTNHNLTSNKGDPTSHIEQCSLSHAEIMCLNLSATHLSIARAQHHVVLNKDNLMFIIGGMNAFDQMEESVEVFDVSQNRMMNSEWFTYIKKGRIEFGAVYDVQSDIIYIVGGTDNTQSAVTTIDYLPICQLNDNCDAREINLECGDEMNGYINESHDMQSYYFEILESDAIVSIEFNSCESTIDTYEYLFVWNETLKEWQIGDNDQWHWDDAGNCGGNQQEMFSIDGIDAGYYHLVLSAHESGNYSSSFLCQYDTTLDPTLEPTVDPTSNPTMNPTQSPTINPTHVPSFDPTVIPTWDPTIFPMLIPSIEPTANPTINPTQIHYDRMWFLLSFVCQSNVDLNNIDVNAMILNALLYAFKPDMAFATHTEIRSNLTQLEDEQMTLSFMTSRQLLSDDESIYYFKIESNITIAEDLSYTSYLCYSSFSYDFVYGLGDSIDRAQLYKLAECDAASLAYTWTVNNDEHMDSSSNNDEFALIDVLPIGILFAILFSIFLFALCVSFIRLIDSLKIGKLLLFSVYFLSVYSDIFFVVHVWMKRLTESMDDEILICFGTIALFIVIVPFIKNIFDLNYHSEFWQQDFVHGEIIREWLKKNGKLLYFWSFILCTTYGSLAVANSNLFGLRAFSMGLPPALYQRFNKQRVWVLLLSNIPQCISMCHISIRISAHM